MAEQDTLVPFFVPPTQVVNTDMTQKQYFCVQINQTTVNIADERSLNAPYILASATRSGFAPALNGPPNIARAVAAETITAGQWVKVYSATGMVGVCSQGGFTSSAAVPLVGQAIQNTTNGSGDMIAVKLIF